MTTETKKQDKSFADYFNLVASVEDGLAYIADMPGSEFAFTKEERDGECKFNTNIPLDTFRQGFGTERNMTLTVFNDKTIRVTVDPFNEDTGVKDRFSGDEKNTSVELGHVYFDGSEAAEYARATVATYAQKKKESISAKLKSASKP